MKSQELTYLLHPMRSRLKWVVFYAAAAVLLGVLFYVFVGRLRTHTLPTGQVELSVPYSTYLVGEPVSFTLTNNFNSVIYAVNHCPDEPLGVYKLVNNTWKRVHAQATKACTDEDRQVKVPAHSQQTVSLAPWAGLFDGPGKYRLVVLVEYYNALPYQDIEFINKPEAKKGTVTRPSPGVTSATEENDDEQEQATPSNTGTPTNPTTNPTSSTDYEPVTYTVHVNSSGNYDITSFSLYTGDSLQIVYSPPYSDEVRTRFTGSPAVASVTVDSDRHSGTRTFTSAGSYTFKADDHSGNTGAITVTNP